MEERNAADMKGGTCIVNSQFCVKHGALGKLCSHTGCTKHKSEATQSALKISEKTEEEDRRPQKNQLPILINVVLSK
jgi:hypothetical protein